MSAPRGREKRGREKTARTMRTITFVSHLFFVILFVYFSASGGGVSGQEDDGEDNNNDDGTNTFWNTGPSTDFRFSQAIDYEVRRRDHVFFLSFFRFVSSSRSVCVCLCFFHVASRDGIQYLTFNVLSLLLFIRVRF